MESKPESKEERLARLEQELADLKAALPEHCYGQDGYISDHPAKPEHWLKIENLEEEIGKLNAELGR